MARITIGTGFVRTPEQEDEMRWAADALPDDWRVMMYADSKTGIFNVRVEGPGLAVSRLLVSDAGASAVRFLRDLKVRP